MPKAVICDIDGVLLHDNTALPGAVAFIRRLQGSGAPYLLLTNYPSQTPGDLRNRLMASDIDVPATHFYTSAMATAAFLQRQRGRKAYVVGEGALTHELYAIGFTITDIDPDFVVVGETRAYNWHMIAKASEFILGGARFVATNPDVAGPGGHPACGALCAPMERITGQSPYYAGKPNAWMMRAALNAIGAHSDDTMMIGDNMRTDILAGVQAGMETVLVKTGVSGGEDLATYPFEPHRVYDTIGDVELG